MNIVSTQIKQKKLITNVKKDSQFNELKDRLVEFHEQRTIQVRESYLIVGHVTFSLENLRKKAKQQIIEYYKQVNKKLVSRFVGQTAHLSKIYEQLPFEQVKDIPIKQFSLEQVKGCHLHLVQKSTQSQALPFARMQSIGDYAQSRRRKRSILLPISKVIWNIQLPQILTLNLSSMNLTTLQPLAYCQFLSLQELILYNNELSSIRIFSKCVFKNLKVISLQNNPISSFNSISRAHTPKLTIYKFDQMSQIDRQNLTVIQTSNRQRIIEIQKNQLNRILNEIQHEIVPQLRLIDIRRNRQAFQARKIRIQSERNTENLAMLINRANVLRQIIALRFNLNEQSILGRFIQRNRKLQLNPGQQISSQIEKLKPVQFIDFIFNIREET